MPTTSEAYVTPALLKWARDRARTTPEVVAKKIGTKPESVTSWEAGKSHPTFRQAEKLADQLLVPFGYLFLPEPPQETTPLPDFRTVKNAGVLSPSADFMALLYDVLTKHWWYKELANQEEWPELPFVAKFGPEARSADVAADIAATLGLDDTVRKACDTWEAFLRVLIERSEANGILVMRSALVPGTRRKVSADEFRGFAISTSRRAPLVFINASDFKAAQIFTIAHELAHVWLGQTGISNEGLAETQGNPIESKCNAIAAEVLTPQGSFLSRWNSSINVTQNINLLARHFRVSSLVVLYRALNLGRLSRDTFDTLYAKEEEQYAKKKPKTKGGPSFYEMLITRNSELFTATVIEAVSDQRTPYAEAASLLNVRVPLLPEVAKQLEKRRARASL